MIRNSYGDLSLHSYLKNRNAELAMEYERLTQEVASGKKSDLTAALGGDFSYLADIENNLNRIESQMVAAQETELFAISMQANLSRMQEGAEEMRSSIIAASVTMTTEDAELLSREADQHMESALGALNSWAGGRSLFAGTATGTTPLNGTDVMMTELLSETAGLTDADDIITAVKDWFSDPAGFDAAMYNGSSTDISPVEIGDGETVALKLRADDPDLTHTLQSYAILALLDEPSLGLSDETKVELANSGIGELTDSTNKLIQAQADIGFMEGQLERVTTRNEATKTSLTLAFNDIVLADQYEASSLLKQTETQLEVLYTVTSRSSQLSLVKYM